VIVTDDEAHAAQATGNQAVEKGAPVDLGLGRLAGDAEHPPPTVGSNPHGGEQGRITDDTGLAQFLVAGIQKEVVDLGQRPTAPGGEFLVEQSCRPADLG